MGRIIRFKFKRANSTQLAPSERANNSLSAYGLSSVNKYPNFTTTISYESKSTFALSKFPFSRFCAILNTKTGKDNHYEFYGNCPPAAVLPQL